MDSIYGLLLLTELSPYQKSPSLNTSLEINLQEFSSSKDYENSHHGLTKLSAYQDYHNAFGKLNCTKNIDFNWIINENKTYRFTLFIFNIKCFGEKMLRLSILSCVVLKQSVGTIVFSVSSLTKRGETNQSLQIKIIIWVIKHKHFMGFFHKQESDKTKYNFKNIIFTTVLAVLIVWSITFLIIYLFPGKELTSGTIGDSFGMMNSLFSALAFALLILTSLMQSQELELQREELTENRIQLEKSAIAHTELVELTKKVNQDKLIPSFSVHEYLYNSENVYKFSLRVSGGHVQNIKLNHSSDKFDYTEPENFKNIYSEGEILIHYQIAGHFIDNNDPNVRIQYETLDGRWLSQNLIFNARRIYISQPESPLNSLII